MKEQPKYLVRPGDFHIYELDESNGCYRSFTNRTVTYSDGTRPNAQKHFTHKILTEGFAFFHIDESELETYEKKNNDYHKFLSWQCRPDGHGGCKGGTYEEYLNYKS